MNTIKNSLETNIGKMFCSTMRRNMSSKLLPYQTRTVFQIVTYLNPGLRNGFLLSGNMFSAKALVKQELANLIKKSQPNTSSEPARPSTSAEKTGILEFLKQRCALNTNPNATAFALNILRMYVGTDFKYEEDIRIEGTEAVGIG